MDEHLMHTYARSETAFARGAGALLFDAEGKSWIDALGGIAVNALGHGHPRLVTAIADQAAALIHTSNLYRQPWGEQVALRLARLSGMNAAFFSNSGSEANETALKIARKYQQQQGRSDRAAFVALEQSFHGRTTGAVAVTHNPKYREPFGPLIGPVYFVPPNDVDALRKAFESEPCAMILEPIQGEGGLRVLDEAFLVAARELCDATDTVLIHDEVQCGSGRTGRFLASQWSAAQPDLVTLAKPIAGGLPMSVVLAAEKLEGVLVPGDHGSTFGGGPLASRAALVFLEELEKGLLDTVQARGEQLRDGLEALAAKHPLVVERRGRGLIQGLKLERGASDVVRECFANGLVAATAGGEVIRLLPPYVITEQQLSSALEILDAVLTKIEA
ncbi:MAG: aspartate aminotransferase family protein [Planctomycetes bacterium]|nr:aspartate aminotransferase family protein [Planctomycetota bacterium]MCB9903651.1 aspartate aminotransferase family protein [Planctomycetota bacterium]